MKGKESKVRKCREGLRRGGCNRERKTGEEGNKVRKMGRESSARNRR